MWNKVFDPKRVLTVMPVLSLLLFVLMLAFSMSIYSGGTRADFNALGYTFSENYISDLGRYIAINGQNNTSAMIVFIFAFFVIFNKIFHQN